MKKGVLECSVDSVESALAAMRGGADRLELCGSFVIGGTTPSPCLFKEIQRQSDIRIHVLIRPRFGDFCYTKNEVSIMCQEIAMFRELGAEAVVIGALCPDGSLDMGAMKQMIEAAGGIDVTMHRAFDMAKDPRETLEKAVELGIKTILTSGQQQNCKMGRELLKELQEQSAGRIEILAGAGIDGNAIRELAQYTGITSYHMSGKATLSSRMEYRKKCLHMGLPSMSEFEIWQTDENKVRAAREALDAYMNGCTQ